MQNTFVTIGNYLNLVFSVNKIKICTHGILNYIYSSLDKFHEFLNSTYFNFAS